MKSLPADDVDGGGQPDCELCGPPIDLVRGGRLSIRHSRKPDAVGFHDLYRRLNPKDLRRRFFTGGPPSERFLEQWATLEDRGGFGLVAELAEGGVTRLVGEAGYGLIEQGSGDGELGITVDPDSRGWLGPWLLDRLLAHAAVRGVPNIQAMILADNSTMLALAAKRGYAILSQPDWGIIRLTIGTAGNVPSWPAAHERPRVLVETDHGRWAGEQAMSDAGFDVAMCGAMCRTGHACPIESGEPCPLVEGADAVIIDFPDSERARDLLQREKLLHPGVRPIAGRDPDVVGGHRRDADDLVSEVRRRLEGNGPPPEADG